MIQSYYYIRFTNAIKSFPKEKKKKFLRLLG